MVSDLSGSPPQFEIICDVSDICHMFQPGGLLNDYAITLSIAVAFSEMASATLSAAGFMSSADSDFLSLCETASQRGVWSANGSFSCVVPCKQDAFTFLLGR